jgi:hypothetical protein
LARGLFAQVRRLSLCFDYNLSNHDANVTFIDMTDKKPPPKTPADLKADRLAQALRDNLRRRKAQTRGREAVERALGDKDEQE